MGLAGLLYLWERRLLGRAVTSLVAILLLFGLALTQSRTPWVISIAFSIWCIWQHRAGRLRLAPVHVLLWLGLYVTFILLLPYLAEWLYLSAGNAVSRAQQAARLDLWLQMWHAVTLGGPWGYGWTQVGAAQVAAALDYPVGLSVEHSHSIILDILLWNGPLLGSVILVLLAGWLLRLYLKARSLESIFCLMAVGAVLVHGLLEFPLEYAYFLLPVCVLLGLAESDQQAPTLGRASRWVAAPALVAGVLACSLVWVEYRFIDEDFRLMRFETAGIGPREGPPPVVEESSWQAPLFSQLRAYIRFARSRAHEDMSEAELSRMYTVSTRFPSPPSMMRYGLALALNDRPDDARLLFLRLRGVHGEKHYQEARASLLALRETYPQLNALDLP